MRAMFLLAIFLWSVASHADETKEINQLLDGFHAAAAASDFDDYFSRFSAEAYFLGTDASERWSVDEFKAYARPVFNAGKGWRYEVLSRNLERHPGSKLVWFDEILMNERLGRCRGTGVVIREGGVWKIAHYSLTLLIPNDIAYDVGQQSMKADGLSSE